MLDREACAETQLSEREGNSCVPLHDVADTLKFSCGPRVSGEVSGEQGLFGHFSTAGRLCCWWSLTGFDREDTEGDMACLAGSKGLDPSPLKRKLDFSFLGLVCLLVLSFSSSHLGIQNVSYGTATAEPFRGDPEEVVREQAQDVTWAGAPQTQGNGLGTGCLSSRNRGAEAAGSWGTD